MKRFITVLAALGIAAFALAATPSARTSGGSLWSRSVAVTNVVASSPTTGGGYPVPPGSRVPEAGTCRPATGINARFKRRLESRDDFATRRKPFIRGRLARGLAGHGAAGPGITGRSRAEIERATFV